MAYGFNEDKSKYDFDNSVILWEQTIPSRTYYFRTQTVTLNDDLENYKSIEVTFNTSSEGYTDPDNCYTTGKIPLKYCKNFHLSGINQYRSCSIESSNSIKFDGGMMIRHSNNAIATIGDNDQYAVPFKIIGYKD